MAQRLRSCPHCDEPIGSIPLENFFSALPNTSRPGKSAKALSEELGVSVRYVYVLACSAQQALIEEKLPWRIKKYKLGKVTFYYKERIDVSNSSKHPQTIHP